MNRISSTLTFLLSVTFVFSCTTKTKSKDTDKEAAAPINSEQTANKIFGINAAGILIRTAPEESAKKIINEKATQTFGETHYCEVDYSTKVEILDTSNDWVKIKVIEPSWLSETHVGWIPSKYLISKEDEEKQSLGKLDAKEYEIMKTNHKVSVQNYHVLLKQPNFDKSYVYQFIKQFRKENCAMKCNVFVYDTKSILPLVEIYPLTGKDYIKLADHFISMSTFDAPEVRDWYPYQDFKYKEYGGVNWKKEPIK